MQKQLIREFHLLTQFCDLNCDMQTEPRAPLPPYTITRPSTAAIV